MADYETILTDFSEAGVFRLTLNRPHKKNAINDQMWEELAEVFTQLRHNIDVRVVIVTGTGDAFSSGADLSGGPRHKPRHSLARMRQVTDVALALHGLPQPTIARVNGVAAGAGLNLALGCDLIVASDQARFSEIFAKRGLSIDFGGTWLLPRLIGLHKAKELAFFADVISAAEAERFGIVNRVVAHDELDAFVDSWAEQLAVKPPIAMAQTKALLNDSLGRTMHEALDAEGTAQSVNIATADMAEAMDAFINKRAPVFRGE
jgi:enoyl-CoA hydratase/carnithine racemase